MSRPLLVLAVALVLPLPSRADDPLPGPPITLPDVEGFARGKPTLYKEKGLGYSVGYTRDEITLTVYVYNQNRPAIPADPDADAVKAEMLDSVSSLEANKASGMYKSITPVTERVVPLGAGETAPKFRWKQYYVELKTGPAFTEVYLAGYKNHFVKMRVTYLSGNAAANRKALKSLLDALGGALE